MTTTHAAPRWFRYGVVALAVAVLCSCRSTEPQFRVAQRIDVDGQAGVPSQATTTTAAEPTIRGQSPGQPAACFPTNCPPGGCPTGACEPGACSCCGPDGLRGPRDEWLCDGGDHGAQA